MSNSVFSTLNRINVNEHTERKNGLTYLSWAWAWAELLKRYPDATYTVYENRDGWCYHTDGKTCWVKTGVTVEGKEYIEYLPVMDFKNRSIPVDAVTSFDVNKAIQRSLTKAVARHGLGLYLYAGEDLPEEERTTPQPVPMKPEQPAKTRVETVREMCRRVNITEQAFGRFKKAAVENGVIPDKMVNSLSDAEFAALLSFVEQNAAA